MNLAENDSSGPLDNSSLVKNILNKTYVVGTQKNRLYETVLLRTHNTDKKIFTIVNSKFCISRPMNDHIISIKNHSLQWIRMLHGSSVDLDQLGFFSGGKRRLLVSYDINQFHFFFNFF